MTQVSFRSAGPGAHARKSRKRLRFTAGLSYYFAETLEYLSQQPELRLPVVTGD